MFYHMVQSFPKGANIDPRTAHEAARRLAGYFEGCEVLVCTHTDREHIHSHCIINSVNFETGKKVHMADEQIQALRVRNDQICEELRLPKFQKDEQRKSSGMSNAEYYPAAKGESWKLELMRVSVAPLGNVEAALWNGLLTDFAAQKGARFLVRGARNSMDFDAEYQLSLIYKDVSGGALDTVLLCAEPAHQHISSTMAREMVKYHQPLEKYLPAAAAARIRGKDRG